MSEFVLIAPGDFIKVEDNSILPYGPQWFAQFNGVGENPDVNQVFRDIGLITSEQFIASVKFFSDNEEVWYMIG